MTDDDDDLHYENLLPYVVKQLHILIEYLSIMKQNINKLSLSSIYVITSALFFI